MNSHTCLCGKDDLPFFSCWIKHILLSHILHVIDDRNTENK